MRTLRLWLVVGLVGLLGAFAPTASATITVVHQYNIGDGLDGGAPGGPAPALLDNVGATNLALSGTMPTFSSDHAYGAWTAANSALSVDLTGANDHGYSAANLLPGVTSNYGVDLWVKTNAASQTRNIFFPNGWEFGSGVGKGGIGIQQSGTQYQVIAPGILNLGGITATPGQWMHLAAVLVGTNDLRMYANGELVKNGTATPSHAGGGAYLGINSGGGANSGFDGLLDHARAFTFAAGQFRSSDLSLGLTNLALGGTASQSSSHPAGPAGNGINSNLNDFTHTVSTDLTPWWRVVMPTNGRIGTVVLNTRLTNPNRLRDIFVDVLNQDGDLVWTSPEQNDGNWMGGPAKITVTVPNYVRGYSVRVRRIPYGPAGDDDAVVLSLAEAQVLGLPLVNVAQGKPATQSSEYPGFPAGNATNGNYGDFTHTNSNDSNAWWRVDLGLGSLGNGYDIESIVLHNRNGLEARLRDITVQVLGLDSSVLYTSAVLNPGNILGGPAFLEVDFLQLLAQTVRGRYVLVSRQALPGGGDNNNVLSLGEVQVFGTDATPEPTTLALLLLGGLSLVRRRKARG